MLPERLAHVRVLEHKVERVPLEVARRLEAVLLEPRGEVPVGENVAELKLLLGLGEHLPQPALKLNKILHGTHADVRVRFE